jgi:hypothetical protein
MKAPNIKTLGRARPTTFSEVVDEGASSQPLDSPALTGFRAM